MSDAARRNHRLLSRDVWEEAVTWLVVLNPCIAACHICTSRKSWSKQAVRWKSEAIHRKTCHTGSKESSRLFVFVDRKRYNIFCGSLYVQRMPTLMEKICSISLRRLHAVGHISTISSALSTAIYSAVGAPPKAKSRSWCRRAKSSHYRSWCSCAHRAVVIR